MPRHEPSHPGPAGGLGLEDEVLVEHLEERQVRHGELGRLRDPGVAVEERGEAAEVQGQLVLQVPQVL